MQALGRQPRLNHQLESKYLYLTFNCLVGLLQKRCKLLAWGTPFTTNDRVILTAARGLRVQIQIDRCIPEVHSHDFAFQGLPIND